MNNTTAGISVTLCNYCGNYHNYSEQMCRDITEKGLDMSDHGNLYDEHVREMEKMEKKEAELSTLREQVRVLREALEKIICILKDSSIDWGIKDIAKKALKGGKG
jgi:hypothetical protein